MVKPMPEKSAEAIGGYFGLELRSGVAWHSDAIALNSGRNALRYLLLEPLPAKAYVPWFTCTAVTEVITGLGIAISQYHVNEAMEPLFDLDTVAPNEVFLYTNYFGLKDSYVRTLATRDCNIIIDNALSFFSPRVASLPTFYSPRKFFGVPDGGYAYGGRLQPLEADHSSTRTAHLMIRHDESAQAGYAHYLANEDVVEGLPVRAMSALSARILQSIDYASVADRRKSNFEKLHSVLGSSNSLPIEDDSECVALTYPYLSNDIQLKARLQAHHIFTATYWPHIAQTVRNTSVEYRYCTQLVHLPIDQRYGEAQMARILDVVLA
jgi:hypothetical protein